jgi:hypothetical protein
MIGPGLILYTLHYMLKNTEKYENARIFGDYHIHEGFVGVIFIISALLLIPLRAYMFDQTIFLNELVFLLGTVQIFMFAFLFFGNFLIIRDWKDVFHLRFIEKKEKREISTQNQEGTSLFLLIKKEDVEFFTIKKIILYPLGIIMMSLSINAIVFGSNFLPKEIFNLEHQEVMLLGFVLSFISGGIIGRDWCRVFRRFYPEFYTELELVLNKLKNS